jgi:DNA-binding NarL/FixJ family response regulator
MRVIARKLEITEVTVKVHVKAILRKIGCLTAHKLPCGRLSVCHDAENLL